MNLQRAIWYTLKNMIQRCIYVNKFIYGQRTPIFVPLASIGAENDTCIIGQTSYKILELLSCVYIYHWPVFGPVI